MRRPIDLFREERGAVAATYAIGIMGLIVVAGVGYDYTRMVAVDSELQNAADQAALAAATQLDQEEGACARASAAAVNLLRNLTMLSNDGRGNRISVTDDGQCGAGDLEARPGEPGFKWVRFFQDKGKTTVANTDAEARFVEVFVDPREALYALTPVVATFRGSGNLNAAALAGIGNAVCKAPPVMICNPGEDSGDPNFTVGNYVGKGLKLVSVGGGPGGWVPGNFGYLDNEGYSNGVPGLREALGWQDLPGDCIAYTGVDTKPGGNVPATDAMNTRFDIYDSNVACPSGGSCPASVNSVKDFRRSANASGPNSCRTTNNTQGWHLPSGYYGETAVSATTPLAVSVVPSAMGHPRDMCHLADIGVTGFCSTPFGNGVWDRDAYFRVNYERGDGSRWNSAQWQANTNLGSGATRYEVYKWEMSRRGDVVDGVTVLGPRPVTATGNTVQSFGRPVCSAGGGVIPGDETPDRRVIPVAVVNCRAQSVNGNSPDVQVAEWIDVFLVEPSFNRARTNAGEIYVEVIGRARLGGGTAGAQQIVKSTPYLIE